MDDRDRTRVVLGCITAVAAIGTGGSLYFSEVMGLVPCDLCWYQRILLYPIVVIAGVATVERRRAAWRTGIPLSLAGTAVAGYHTVLQLSPDATCTLDGGCTTILWSGLYVFTIPRLALVAFLLCSVGFIVLALEGRSRDDRP